MAKKRKNIKQPREMTRRELSHWQREKRRQRLIFITGVFTVAAVLVLVLVGWYLTDYRPLHETVIRVNDTTFNMSYYIEMLKLRGKGQSASFLQYLAPIEVQEIQRNELIRQEAATLGFTVSDSEIKAELKEAKLPNDAVYFDFMRSQLLVNKLTDEYFDKQVPTSASQVNIAAMLLESEAQASDIRARLERGEDFAKLAEELSLDNYTKTNKGALGWHPQDVLMQLLSSAVPGDYAFGSVAGALSQPRYDAEVSKQVGYWLINVTDRKEATNEAQVNAMLLSSEDQAKNIKSRLEAGEDFAALAKENSQLDGAGENGGNLGFLTQDGLTKAPGDFVFSTDTKLNTLSNPIKDTTVSTQGGYWLVKVLEKADDRQIDTADRDVLKAKATDDWVASLWLNPNYELDDYLDQAKIAWAISKVGI